LWGILGADERWGEIVTARLDLRGLWQLILDHAPKKLDQKDVQELKSINEDLVMVTRDRNIIVHGRIHAVMRLDSRLPHYEIVGPAGADYDFSRVPCWTILKGAEAKKNFPVSTKAVEIVRVNILKLAERVQEFNKRFGHFQGTKPGAQIEIDWPKLLE
jgi:hypothetical protein